MGKFYELFEMDAHVGAKDLDLQYMKARTSPYVYAYWSYAITQQYSLPFLLLPKTYCLFVINHVILGWTTSLWIPREEFISEFGEIS